MIVKTYNFTLGMSIINAICNIILLFIVIKIGLIVDKQETWIAYFINKLFIIIGCILTLIVFMNIAGYILYKFQTFIL